jgi:hypothetical protein
MARNKEGRRRTIGRRVEDAAGKEIREKFFRSVEEQRMLDEKFVALQELAAKHGGVALSIHDSVEVQIPEENLEAFTAEGKKLGLL